MGRYTGVCARWPAVCAFVVGALSVLAGCGGGGAGGDNLVTRLNDRSYSEDAKRLAARSSTGPWISANLANIYQRDLSGIRTKYANLNDIHAAIGFSLTDVLISVKSSASFATAWKAGTVRTGVASIDNVLAPYNPVSVQRIADFGAYQVYLLQFAQSLNITALLNPIKSSSPDITQTNYN